MNQQDREALEAIAQQLNDLQEGLKVLDYLSDEDAVKAIKGLVETAPTLKKLTQAYEAAGWFTGLIKVLGAIAAAILAIAAMWTLYFGEHK